MGIKEKISRDEIILFDILRHPVLGPEFIYNIDKLGYEEEFEFHDYQNEMLCDFNSYVSLCCARAIGKTVALVALITWLLINNFFPEDYIVYTVPNKAQLEPVWAGLTRQFRSNTFLKWFVEQNKGINSSEHSIKLINSSVLLCRIAGTSGTGANVIGLHTPFEILDECIVGTQRVLGLNSNKRASDLKIGDVVLSWNGEKIEEDRIKSIEKIKRNQKVLEIGYASGYIRVGENHRIFSSDGYILAKELKVNNFIYSYKNTRRKYWNDKEIQQVVSLIKSGKDVPTIAKKLNRSPQSIYKKLYSLGIAVHDSFDSINLTYEQYQILLGSLLGDGSINKYANRASYTTNHSYKQIEYVDWIYNKLKNICRSKPKLTRNGGWGTYNYQLSTLGRIEILDLYNILYINNIKTVTMEYLSKLDTLGLAVWFMDDGSYGSLSTHSFSKEENELISEFLYYKWTIKTKVKKYKNKDLYYLQINNMKYFSELISEYIHPSLQYKLYSDQQVPNKKITFPNKIEETISTLNKKKITYIKEVNTRAKYLYSIEVEKNHNYFVNGILTKNSGYYPWGTWLELQPTLNTWQNGYRQMVSGVPTGLREQNVCYHADQSETLFSTHRISAYDNPRFSKEDEEQAIKNYGGKDSEDFAHLVLGIHGSPIFAVFDRRLFDIKKYEVYQLKINGLKMKEGIEEYLTKLAFLPALPSNNGVIMGVDLGYTDPTAIIIMYLDKLGKFRFHCRIQLTKVSYNLQDRIIDMLDTKFKPSIIGVDEGNSGMAVTQRLIESEDFAHKHYDKKLLPINFSSSIVIGEDLDGKEIKSRTKPFSVSILQDYVNNHRITFSSTDPDLMTELERMTYSKNITGDISYRTLTPKGGKKGDDHFTAALLCATLSYYIENESFVRTVVTKKLMGARWI